MIRRRVATPEDAPALVVFALESHQEITEIPDIVFLCEDTDEDRILGTIGLTVKDGMPVLHGMILPPDVYADTELRRAVAEDGWQFVRDWLIANKCHAFVCYVSRRNTRMQRWIERHGGRCYTTRDKLRWYVTVLSPELIHEDTPESLVM